MVDSRQAPGQVVRLLISRRNRHAKAQVLGGSSHGRHDSQGLIDRPLSSRDYGRVEVSRTFVDVVSAQHVCNENAMKLGGFEQLGQLDPVVHVVEAPGLVVGVAPEAGRLVAAACFLSMRALQSLEPSLHISTKALRMRLLWAAILMSIAVVSGSKNVKKM